MTDQEIKKKIKQLEIDSDNLYKLGKYAEYVKIEELIYKYSELIRTS